MYIYTYNTYECVSVCVGVCVCMCRCVCVCVGVCVCVLMHHKDRTVLPHVYTCYIIIY